MDIQDLIKNRFGEREKREGSKTGRMESLKSPAIIISLISGEKDQYHRIFHYSSDT
jgi:hypothetical protein